MPITTQPIPTGYKSSPLGPIPQDWEVKSLLDCCLIKGEYGINAPATDFKKELPTYIRITDIDDNGNYSAVKKASVNDENSGKFILENGDILFARTGATVGKTYLYNKKDGKLVFAGFLIRFRPNENILLAKHLKYFTSTKLYWDRVKTISMRSGQPGINAEEYGSLKLPLPPLSEQTAIATILSTTDTAIQHTQEMIKKLEIRNKGLGQKLLQNKKWKEERFGDIFERITKKNTEKNTNIVTISAQRGFVKQTDFFNKAIASEILDNYFLVEKGEFCYNKSYSNGYPMGATKRLNNFEKAVVTTLYICFKIKDTNKISGDFFEHFFNANLLDKGLIQIAHEGGRAHGLLNVTPDDFFNLKIKIPETEEQIKISNILNKATQQLNQHKQKLAKLQTLKKGLMQQLLTGKVRMNNIKKMRILMLKELEKLNNIAPSPEFSFEILKEFLLDESTEAFLAEEHTFGINEDFIKCNKHLVDNIDKTKIEVRSNEHTSAHFHVKIAEYESSYDIKNCEYMNGNLPRNYEKKVILWYKNGGKEKLIEKRNQTRPEHCQVGKI